QSVACQPFDQQAGAEVDGPVPARSIADDVRVGLRAIDVLQQGIDGAELLEERLRQRRQVGGLQVGRIGDECDTQVGTYAALNRLVELVRSDLPGEPAR